MCEANIWGGLDIRQGERWRLWRIGEYVSHPKPLTFILCGQTKHFQGPDMAHVCQCLEPRAIWMLLFMDNTFNSDDTVNSWHANHNGSWRCQIFLKAWCLAQSWLHHPLFAWQKLAERFYPICRLTNESVAGGHSSSVQTIKLVQTNKQSSVEWPETGLYLSLSQQ